MKIKGDRIKRYIKNLSWKKIIILGTIAVFGIIFGTGVFTYWGLFGKLPDYIELKNIKHADASEVISEEGVTLGKFYVENRVSVNAKNVSPYLTNALIATEDTRFYEHNGFDWRSLGRVIFKSLLLRDESSGGGSTITQQLAKNLFPRHRYWFGSILINKWREIITALRIEKVYTKNEILNLYLNTVPFSDNIYGIEVACRRFFNTTSKDIKVEEAAVLIGMLKGNYIYHPHLFPERALARRNTVLGLMEKHSFLKQTEVDSLKKLKLVLKYTKENHDEGLATYFREHLRLEVTDILKKFTKPNGQPYNIYRDGLRIYTTVSSRLQRYAEEAVQTQMTQLQKDFDKAWDKKRPWETEKTLDEWMKKSERYISMDEAGASDKEIAEAFNKKIHMTIFNWSGDRDTVMSPMDSIKYYAAILNVGFLAIDPSTGHVKAWVGGTDFSYFKYDHVKSTRQVGSTFKPFVYTAALEQGVSPCTWYPDTITTYNDYEEWRPVNSDNKETGKYYSMKGGLAFSKNTISVQVLFKAGIKNVVDVAHRMGITSKVPSEPSIVLGTADISLWDMVTAYGTFANRGKKPQLRYLRRIETKEGKVLVDFGVDEKQELEEVVKPEYCDVMNKMLRGVIEAGTGKRLITQFRMLGPIAGKTGTTQDNTDGWFIAYKPHLVAGVWVGADNPVVKFKYMSQGQGSNSALPVWGWFMYKMQNDKDHRKIARDTFTEPQGEYAAMLNCAYHIDELPGDSTEHKNVIQKILSVFGLGKDKDKEKEKEPPPAPKPAATLPKNK